MAYERSCALCGGKYQYCPHCSDFDSEPKWKTMFHDNNCKTIFDILQKHFLKQYSDAEAVTLLNACDLSVIDNATEAVRNDCKAILDSVKEKEVSESKKTASNATEKTVTRKTSASKKKK